MSAWTQYVLSGLSLGCIYALVALGIVLIVNVTGVYNFAVGNYVMFGGLIMYGTAGVGGWNVPLAIVVTSAVTAGIAASPGATDDRAGARKDQPARPHDHDDRGRLGPAGRGAGDLGGIHESPSLPSPRAPSSSSAPT